MAARDYVDDLASRGIYHFSTEEAEHGMGVSRPAARAALRRLKKDGIIAAPRRGFHVIVPPEYRRLGCLPADQFVPQLMDYLGIPYYVGLLSAARYHGAAHQQPQVFQVIVPRNRKHIECGKVAVSFFARHNTADIPTTLFNTQRGRVSVSSPEATAFDLVGYPQHCGGLDNVATVLIELTEKLDPERLAEVASHSPMPWAQRTGYLLELIGESTLGGALEEYVRRAVTETALLSPAHDLNRGPRDKRWKLKVNVEVEPEL